MVAFDVVASPFRGVGVGLEERHVPHVRLTFQFVELGFHEFAYSSAYTAHQSGLVLWYWYYLGMPVFTCRYR